MSRASRNSANMAITSKTLTEVAIQHMLVHHCSEQELRDYLQAVYTPRSHAKEDIEAAIAHLNQLKLIDSQKERIAHSLSSRYSDKDRRFLGQQFKRKGLDEDFLSGLLEKSSHTEEQNRDSIANVVSSPLFFKSVGRALECMQEDKALLSPEEGQLAPK